MAQVLLVSPSGQKVYSDDSNAQQHQQYLTSGFKLANPTPTPVANTPAPAPAPVNNISNQGSAASQPGPVTPNPSLTAPGGAYAAAAGSDLQKQVQAMSASAGGTPTTPTPKPADNTPSNASTSVPNMPSGSVRIDDPAALGDYENVQYNGVYGSGGYYSGSKIDKVTLTNAAGQQVSVRADNKDGQKADFLSKGYAVQGTGQQNTPTTGTTGSSTAASSSGSATPNNQGLLSLLQSMGIGGSQQPSTPQGANGLTASGASSGGSVPSGYTKIDGAKYNTSALQQGAFSDIHSSGTGPGSFLYGKAKGVIGGAPTSGGGGGSGGAGGTTGAMNIPDASTAGADIKSDTPAPYQPPSGLDEKLKERANQLAALQAIIDKVSKPGAEEMGLISQENSLLDEENKLLASEKVGEHNITDRPMALASKGSAKISLQNQASDKMGQYKVAYDSLESKVKQLQSQRAAASDQAKSQLDLAKSLYAEQDKETADAKTPDTKEYEFAKSQGYTGTFIQYLANKQSSDPNSQYQIIADPISGGIFRIKKAGAEGQVGGGFTYTPTGVNTDGTQGDLGGDPTGLLAKQIIADPGRYSNLTPDQQKAVNVRLSQNGYNIPGANSKPLSDAAAKTSGYVATLHQGLKELDTALKADYQGTVQGILTGTDRYTSNLVTNLADAFGRLRSGGAVNKDEEARFTGLLVSPMDLFAGSYDTAHASIERILNEADTTYTAMGGSSPQSNQGTLDQRLQQQGYDPSEVQALRNQGYQDQDFENLLGAKKKITYSPDETQKVASAIGQFESGGNYHAIGADTGNGNRALGKYQIMASNVPSWSRDVLGHSVTPAQFLASPALQDQIAHAKIDKLLQTYGNLDDVASVWFSGKPAHKNLARDVNNTSVPQYIANVKSIYDSIT